MLDYKVRYSGDFYEVVWIKTFTFESLASMVNENLGSICNGAYLSNDT